MSSFFSGLLNVSTSRVRPYKNIDEALNADMYRISGDMAEVVYDLALATEYVIEQIEDELQKQRKKPPEAGAGVSSTR